MSRSRKQRGLPPLRTRKEGTIGFTNAEVNEAINALLGRQWRVCDDGIYFEAGWLVKDGDYFRVVGHDGQRYRGALRPSVAVEAFRRGMIGRQAG